MEQLVKEFGISEEEAIGGLNDLWYRFDKKPVDEDHEYFFNYESVRSWAYIVYYGNNDEWWNKSKSEMKPRPYSRK